MPLKEKNNMYRIIYLAVLIIIGLQACKTEPKELTEVQKRERDSLSRVEQGKKADSIKGTNPLLIVPPDSEYTGDYQDKYENGIIKFKGFFRFGKRHGQWLSFYPSGLLWSEMSYDKGLRQGPNITYYKNGKKRYEGFYKKDEQDSVWTYYDTTEIIAEKVLYKNDKIVKRLPFK
jgi:antitoxin component YwqK of YwqJK toxin-antitoxin module